MSFIPKNPLSMPEIDKTPPTPSSGTRGLFAKKDGWYEIDCNGNEKKIGSDVEIEIDNELSTTSTNPVQNKVVTEALKRIEPMIVSITLNSDNSEIVEASASHMAMGTARESYRPILFVVRNEKGQIIGEALAEYYDSSFYAILHQGTKAIKISCTYTGLLQYSWDIEALENLEPFVIEATLIKESTSIENYYRIESSVSSGDEIINAYDEGKKFILRLTDEIGCVSYCPAYYGARAILRWYIHYNNELLEIELARITDDLGSPIWHVVNYEYSTKDYVDDAIANLELSGGNITVDTALSNTSTNPVQNKAVAEALEEVKPFIIDATLNEDNTITSSITFDDVHTAYTQGKNIILKVYSASLGLTGMQLLGSVSENNFAWLMDTGDEAAAILLTEEGWYVNIVLVQELHIVNLYGDLVNCDILHEDDYGNALAAFNEGKQLLLNFDDVWTGEKIQAPLAVKRPNGDLIWNIVTGEGATYTVAAIVEESGHITWNVTKKDVVTEDYVDNAIGDIETSLENIITKYGLGGDSV